MPYPRPTLTELRDQALQDVTSGGLPGVAVLLRKSVLRIMAMVQAGFAYLHYGYIDWISKQSVPWTATDEFLLGWGALKNVLPKPATLATGYAVWSNGTPGTPLPSGSTATRADGFAYTTTTNGEVGTDGTVTVPIVASTYGSDGEADAGTTLTLSPAIAGIVAAGQASGAISGGADAETDDAYRPRVLSAYASEAQGGTAADYESWALAVAGVTRAWAQPVGMGPGTVVVWIMLDVARATDGGFPQGSNGLAASDTRGVAATGDQLVVANAIAPLQPVTPRVYVCAPIAQPVNFTITDLSPNTSTIVAGINAAIADLFVRIGSPQDCSIYQSDYEGAIGSVPGIQRFTLASVSVGDTFATGYLPTLGTVAVSG